MKRKEFLKIAAAGAAVGLGQLALSACKSSTPTTPTTPSGSKTFISSLAESHTHSVVIARTEVDSPPAGGFVRDTSVYSGHIHTFTISLADLATVAGGGTVTVNTSTEAPIYSAAHFHTFTISKWYSAGKSILNF